MVEHEHEFLEKSSLDHSSYLAAVEVILSNLHFSDQESYSIINSAAEYRALRARVNAALSPSW
ncbi:MAG: hypothetical protein V1728_00545 [Candidatus Micrarchaeota archaeon]